MFTLFVSGMVFCWHTPLTQAGSRQSVVSSSVPQGVLSGAEMCVCAHTMTFDAFSSHPAVVHALPSVSVHGVLASFATHVPVVWSQPLLHWSILQLRQIGRSLVCW